VSGGDNQHPSDNELAAFGLGLLDEEASAVLERHLAECVQCRAVVESSPVDAFLQKLRASASTGAELASEAPTVTGNTAPLPLSEAPAELARHPRYRLLHLLGAGGMGAVFKAEHLVMDRPVALKVIRHDLTGDPAAVERFRREVRSAARLAHPNIVTAHDADQAGDVHFLAMEYVAGISLDQLVQTHGPLSPMLAGDYARQAALGLQHAFEQGMVHRDIKPRNLMRTLDGRIKVLDFGLARFASESTAAATGAASPVSAGDPGATLTAWGSLMGTPDYMAPEQAVNPHTADSRADIYSLGCTLYFLLTGQAPFPTGDVIEKVMAHAERAPKPLAELRPDVPLGLVRIVERMMAKDPARRYQTPAEVVRALEEFAAEAAKPAPLEAAALPKRRRRLVLTAGVGSVLFFTFLVLSWQSREETVSQTMATLYLVTALVGGTLLGCQFLLSLLGLGQQHGVDGHDVHDGGPDLHGDGDHDIHGDGDHDMAHDGHSSWFAGVLTFRTVVVALTFFGLAGRASIAAGLEPAVTFTLALAAGASALLLVAWMMRSLYQLRAEGTVRIRHAVGQAGTVYLPIPAAKAGAGKVLLSLQNRTVEYQAVTPHAALPVGAKVQVVAVVNSDTVEVVPANPVEKISHV
jgi:tRNA A-37 threonylcarbamoyl transferase component Bud32